MATENHPSYSHLGKNEIRVLLIDSEPTTDIRCSFEVVNLDTHPQYDCLSYTWLNPLGLPLDSPIVKEEWENQCPKSVTLGGKPLAITRNLLQCLRVLRRKGIFREERRFWIDAICIHQADEKEKVDQIPLMGRIYDQAQRVVIWLGPEDHYSQEAVSVINRLAEVTETPNYRNLLQYYDLKTDDPCPELGIESSIDSEEWQKYTKFLQRSWFSRVWVAQEAYFAKSIFVFCGDTEILWDDLTKSAKVLQETGLAEALQKMLQDTIAEETITKKTTTQDNSSNSLIKNSINNQFILTVFGGKTKDKLYLDKLLYYAKYLESGKPHDRVFGFTGIWQHLTSAKKLEADIVVNYGLGVAEIFTSATYAAIREVGNLNTLRLVAQTSPPSTEWLLPSWVPDYTCFQELHNITVTRRDGSARSTWNADGKRVGERSPIQAQRHENRLAIKGIQFQTIEHAGPLYSEIDGDLKFCDLLGTLLDYSSSQSPYGLNYAKAWCQTLIAGRFRDQPADDEALRAFRLLSVYFMDKIDGILEEDFDKYDAEDIERLRNVKMRSQQAISDLAARDLTKGVMPTLREIEDIISDFYNDPDSPQTRQLDRDLGDIRRSFESAYIGRRIFRTTGNYLGIAPQTLQLGDEVWILSGADTPYVLRKMKSEEGWQVIGEAYVHGIMYGEAANAQFQDLYLV
ncbi:heterokaryon incompatibility protein-domain-containing protein [Xylariaceae sp. FL1651]|nr:heterokaryon incompatibility protein-domain-containing protein [Xylariaceae sp. FL1651]